MRSGCTTIDACWNMDDNDMYDVDASHDEGDDENAPNMSSVLGNIE